MPLPSYPDMSIGGRDAKLDDNSEAKTPLSDEDLYAKETRTAIKSGYADRQPFVVNSFQIPRTHQRRTSGAVL